MSTLKTRQLLIEHVTIIPMTGRGVMIPGGVIAVTGDCISYVGPRAGLPADFTPTERLDGGGHLALPGLVNSHTHVAMTVLRNYADDLPLMSWLTQKIWPLEDRLTGEDAYYSSLLGMVEMIKSGTTTFADMYMFTEEMATAADRMGLRACLSRGLQGATPGDHRFQETKDLYRRWHCQGDGRITVMVGPHAPFTCTLPYLEKALELAEDLDTGIHIHLSETESEVEQMQQEYGKSPVALVADLGFFRRHTLAAHCVRVSPQDIEILKTAGVHVAHNPGSNLKLGSGIAPVPAMLAQKINVALGTDSAASNNNLSIFKEMNLAALLHKGSTGNPVAVDAYTALEMATINGAGALALDHETGTLTPGKKADIILVAGNQAHAYPHYNPIAYLAYAASSSDVDTVIINGRVVMEHRQLTTMDEAEILARAEACAQRLVGMG